MRKLGFAGTFDPLTSGHIWVIKEGLNMAEELVLLVGQNSSKGSGFLAESKRISCIKEALIEQLGAEHSRVSIKSVKQEYIAQTAKHLGCDYLIRGIRNSIDFEYEATIQETNVDILEGCKTIFVMPPKQFNNLSSSFVKGLMVAPGWHWAMIEKNMVPKAVLNAIVEQYVINEAGMYFKETELAYLMELYKDERRHYHTLAHVAHCIQELKWLYYNHPASFGDNPEYSYGVCIRAIVAHDCVYFTESPEKDSAQMLLSLNNNYKKESALVLATHASNGIAMAQNAMTNDSLDVILVNIMRSVDFTILGQNSVFYRRYKQAIQREYSHYSETDYFTGRQQVMEKILEDVLSDKCYLVKELNAKYKDQAVLNIQAEISEIKRYLSH